MSDGFSILYGPNGVGKTKFLEIIKAATEIDGQTLSQLPFSEIKIRYSDGALLLARRDVNEISSEGPGRYKLASVKFEYRRHSHLLAEWLFEDDGFYEWANTRTRYEQYPDGSWIDVSDGEVVSTEDMLEMYSRRPGARRRGSAPIPEGFSRFKETHAAFLIEAQRLSSKEFEVERDPRRPALRSRRREVSRIMKQAQVIKALLNDAQTEHSKIAQKLDRTFPHRVLEAHGQAWKLNAEAIRERYGSQDELRSRVGRIASVSTNEELPLPDTELEPWALVLLDLYLRDTEMKLDTFVPLLSKIELLESIVNNRLLQKRLEISEEAGFSVIRNSTNEKIPLDLLSSGEQHEIILMIDLLFNVPRGAVVLIDEPEISLHVAWQIAFIPDVRRIAELAEFTFIVATHSPQIINGEWDRATRLGPPEAAFQ
ncbi:AAA family ATPase [Brachybacterium paraconglomeratum]|uniref:AAA family ATPase n=1 Tax=Brachybacterium paraconglomeratum TaxID=173362 RepID=UPI00223C0516|nr:AAA family ATPase [Brachybacterium paraconglomeratum]MCT1436515.1 AAA family ATPase [Brachybacterium paraconglomeratum]